MILYYYLLLRIRSVFMRILLNLVLRWNNNVIICNNDVIMVLCYYVFLLGKTHHQPWADYVF